MKKLFRKKLFLLLAATAVFVLTWSAGSALAQSDTSAEPAGSAEPTTMDCGSTYVVQPGDWLHRIARQCGVSVEALLDANPQITDPSYIWPGLELTIPSIDVTATTLFNLNFRPVPTINSTPMDVIPAGTTVDVNGRNLAGDWLFVNYQGQPGWIAGWLTAVEGDLADVPPIPADDPVTFPPQDQEAIVIEEPGPGSRVTSPIVVRGVSDPAQHQEIVARLVYEDGTVAFEQPVQIEAPLGQRGPYEAIIPFSVSGERQAFVQMLIRSARDGRITHLSSAGVTLTGSGPADIVTQEAQPARVTIYQPQTNSTISGGVATISGFGLASFEQTLLVEIHDEAGNTIAAEPVMVDAPDLGQPGYFSIDLPYSVDEAGHGRVVVRDRSAAFAGDVYVTSVEIMLQP
jgi:phage tail protein X